MVNRTKQILIGIIFVMMFLPFVQNRLNLFHEKPLFGRNYDVKEPKFTWGSWFSKTYQDSMHIYINSTVGFKPMLMRIKNQIAFSFFHKAKANGVAIGLEGCLFDQSNIKAWTGEDFVGKEKIDKTLKTLKEIQDGFAWSGKKLALILVSGKGYFFPEYIPGNPAEGENTNYKYIIEMADSLGINLLDLSKHFRVLKKKSDAPLYNKNGMHFTKNGYILAMDTIISFAEKLSNKDLPNVVIDGVKWETTNQYDENDLAKGMNLFFDSPLEKLAYPQYHIESGKPDLNVLLVGDSYASGMYYSDIWEKSFRESDYYFYFRELQRRNGGNSTSIDLKNELDKRDVIFLVISDGNLPELGWGFIEKAAEFYSEPKIRAARVKIHEERIRANAEWMEIVKKKANEKGISLDSMMYLDATYIYEHEGK